MSGAEYQVAIFDAVGGCDATLRATLARTMTDLQLDSADLSFFDETTIGGLDQLLPRVGVLFTDDARGAAPQYARAVDVLRENSAVVVPVVHAVENFPSKVPPSLYPVNALKLNPADTEFDDVAGLVLELLGLLRDRRRVFISYKRLESAGVALQLHGRLDARSFDVFLDTLSVKPADPFQETLWHRMADCDLLVLLYTKSVLESGWVAEELARAAGMGLTIVQVIWPGLQRDRRTDLLEPHYLSATDFEDAEQTRLTDAALDELAVVVERTRARSLAARESLLVGNLCDLARLWKIEPVVQRTRFVDLFCPGDGSVTRVVAALGVPDAQAIQHCTRLPKAAKEPQSVVLLYDAVSVATAWLAHLKWLDDYLPVKTIKTADLKTWLPTLCTS